MSTNNVDKCVVVIYTCLVRYMEVIKMKEIRREYKLGRSKFQLREYEGTYFLDKITKAYGYCVYHGTEEEMK